MELTFAERKAVTKAIAIHYARLDKAGKSRVLDELCATTGCTATTSARRSSMRSGPGS
jgi:hypothetical protein